MMKNTEWGAVAYLQHSKYGSMSNVRINNNSDYVTGYGTDRSVTQPWNTATGYLASTTGNISGVYDMSGGAWEYVMGIMLDRSGNRMSGRNSKFNSGFSGVFGCPTCDGDNSGLTELTTGLNFPDSRYYDVYPFSDADEMFYRRILGDATGEMGPIAIVTYGTQNRQISSWYADESWFVTHVNPWFARGTAMYIGSDTGVFAFGYSNGRVYGYGSFRVVLAFS